MAKRKKMCTWQLGSDLAALGVKNRLNREAICYGDLVRIEVCGESVLGVYDKSNSREPGYRFGRNKVHERNPGPIYLATRRRGQNPKYATVGAHSLWRIVDTTSSPQSGPDRNKPLTYGKPFYLMNADLGPRRWLSDDKQRPCFNGADGYFGLAREGRCANQYKFTGGQGHILNGASGLTMVCASQAWKCQGKPITIYPKNEANYLVWDESSYPKNCLRITKAKPRPFYVMEHMCNRELDVDQAIKDGANAIEFDITAEPDNNGKFKFRAHHGRATPEGVPDPYGPRSTASTPIDQYLNHLISKKNQCAIVLFDCKDIEGIDEKRRKALYFEYGKQLGQLLKQKNFPGKQCVLSVPSPHMVKGQGMARGYFDGVKESGFTPVGRDVSIIRKHFVHTSFKETLRRLKNPNARDPNADWIDTAHSLSMSWLGIGIDAYVPIATLHAYLRGIYLAVCGRNANKSPRKVYYWTLNHRSSMRQVISLGADGICVNGSKRLHQLVVEEFPGSLKLATRADNDKRHIGF